MKQKLESLNLDGEDIDITDHYDCYLLSLYFLIQTITTVGYGEINPTNTIERVVVTFFMLVGAVSFSFAAGSISSIMNTMDELSEQKKQLMQNVNRLRRVSLEYEFKDELYE